MAQSNHESLPWSSRLLYILPSTISVVRLVMAIIVLAMITRWPNRSLLVVLIGVPMVFGLDAVDGVVARWLRVPTLIGSFIDIAADRVVEFIFLQSFLSAKLVPGWFVGAFYGRILLTDMCRVLAFGMEQVSAKGIFLPKQLRPLVLSRVSRTAYGALKGVFFAVVLLGEHSPYSSLSFLERPLMFAVLAFSMARASPIIFTYLPRVLDLRGSKLREYTHPAVHDVAPRSTRVFSCLQLASDFGLATWLLLMAWR